MPNGKPTIQAGLKGIKAMTPAAIAQACDSKRKSFTVEET